MPGYNTKIIASGIYVPEKRFMNSEFPPDLNTSDEWIFSRTGIKARHIASQEESVTFMATKALEDALGRYKIDPQTIDGVIVATSTPDLFFPSTASQVQGNFEILNCGLAFDVNAICAGYVYAIANADSLIKAGLAKRIAVIGVDKMSKLVDWSDRSTCVLFGDGAGALILERSDNPGIEKCELKSDGRFADILKCGVSGVHMHGKEVFKNAVEKMSDSLVSVTKASGRTLDELDIIIPHQANKRIFDGVAKNLELPNDRFFSIIEEYGNTSAASIPMAYAIADKSGLLQGKLIGITAIGAGLAWGSVLIQN